MKRVMKVFRCTGRNEDELDKGIINFMKTMTKCVGTIANPH